MRLKHARLCPFCKKEIPADAVFCIMCGKRVAAEPEKKPMEHIKTCRYCGTVLPAGSLFCAYCARLLDDMEEQERLHKAEELHLQPEDDSENEIFVRRGRRFNNQEILIAMGADRYLK